MSEHLLSDFIAAMQAANCAPAILSQIQPDDVFRDYQIAGDHKKKGRYVLKIEGDRATGGFMDRRDGVFHKYISGAKSEWTDAQKTEWRSQLKRAQKLRDDEQAQEWSDAAKEAEARWAAAVPAPADHPYLVRKGVGPHGVRLEGASLVIPGYFDNHYSTLQFIDDAGGKLFLPGARKKGCYYPLAAKTDSRAIIIVTEGFATSASIRTAYPGVPVVCAFDAGNLEPVAWHFKKKYPQARIIFAADNDRTTMIKGEPHNTGILAAQQAAAKIGGAQVVWPEFHADDKTSSDFNDAHQILGLDYVYNRIQEALTPCAPEEAGGGVSDPQDAGVQAPASDNSPPPDSMAGDFGLPFKVLGYNEGEYFYFPFTKQQIVALSPAAHTLNNLLQLADLNQWEYYAGPKTLQKQIPVLAANAMMATAHTRGVFRQEDKVRGCGAWIDAGRAVIHCGDRLIVDGQPMKPRDLKSNYVYAASSRLFTPHEKPLTNAEADKLRIVCSLPTWENPLSGSLLAGWLVIAPICGALDWRPHVWLQGVAESGKSSLVTKIIKPILGPVSMNVDGATTESSIRNRMGYDARPLVFDEAEGKGKNITSMDGVLALARLASSGGSISKYGQKPFTARFCAVFSSINPPLKDFADETRVSKLNLLKNTAPDAQQKYQDMLSYIEETITKEYGERLLSRTIENMPVLLKNIKVFRHAARSIIKGARAADQISAMLAGLYLLGSTKEVTLETAEEIVARYDWSDHTAIKEDPDPVRLLQHISTSIIRVNKQNGGATDVSVGELIVAAAAAKGDIDPKYADRILRQYSIVAKPEGVSFGYKNKNLSKLLSGTDWEMNWAGMMSNHPGAERHTCTYFAPGDKQRSVSVPLSAFYDQPVQQRLFAAQDEEVPFD